MDWKVEDAQAKFPELVEQALHDGPQRVVRDEETVVIISEDEYRSLKRHEPKKNDFLEFLMSGPGLEDLDLTRDKSPMREFEW